MGKSKKKARLSLYKHGNDRCPICLSTFTEKEVEEGIVVTLEHVPPKSVAHKASLGMCLTCADCNNSSGRGIDQAAATLMKTPKGRLDVRGVPYTAYIKNDGTIAINGRGKFYNNQFIEAFNAKEKMSLTISQPDPRVANVSWLKAAYLSVFSLLGKSGYDYAEGTAVRQVREQILRPEKDIICNYAMISPKKHERRGILLNRKKLPCWVVMMGECVVLLPSSRDNSFYDNTELLTDGDYVVGDGPFCIPVKFGKKKVTSVEICDADSLEEAVGSDLFGRTGELSDGDMTLSFVVVEYDRQFVSVLFTRRLKLGLKDSYRLR